jgi:bile acid-coenzyme A ligase
MTEMPMARVPAYLAALDPGRPAVTCDGVTVTRAELDQRTSRLAGAFRESGVRPGQMVTIALPNGHAFIDACVACWKAGAIPQPVSAQLPAHALREVLALAQSALLLGGPDAAWSGCPQLTEDRVTAELRGTGSSRSDDPLPAAAVPPSWKAPTSGGSTGRPKLILAGQPAVIDPDKPAVPYMGTNDTQLVAGPLYHNGPLIYALRGLLTGHHLVVMPRFRAEEACVLMERYGVTWAMLVPTMMNRIWRLGTARPADFATLRMILHLAAPCPRWLKEAWIGWLGPDRVWELYAGTEAQGITVIGGRDWLAHRGSVGRPALGSKIRVLDPEGHDLPPGEVGEIFMMPAGGTGSTYRYIGATPRRTHDGWDSIGDLGWLDGEGYLYLADRRSDLIISGGANVYPAEVEGALESHPSVRASAVIGLPDDDLGERVHALIEETTPVTDDELRAHLSDRLARYKVPRSFERVTTPLRDEAGKLRRFALRNARTGPG